MSRVLPVCCAPEAYRSLADHVSEIESPDGLVSGAVAIAVHLLPKTDGRRVDAILQQYADTVRSRVRRRQPQAVVAHLHEVLFEEAGFTGNTRDYYDVSNNLLPAVLESKCGLPVTLSLIYKAVAGRVGLRTWGVNVPGHFLLAVDMGPTPMLVDPFSQGRVISRQEAYERLREMLGEQVEWPGELLRPASHRVFLTRMLQNLLNTYSSRGQYKQVAAMLEMEMLLWPGESHLQRDLALVLARSGLKGPAREFLSRYLAGNPEDPQRGDLTHLLEALTV